MDEPGTQPRSIGSHSDQELMRRLRSGDSSVLRPLLARYLTPLTLYAERTLGGLGDPQEAVQEAFIRLWTHRETWREGGSIRSLLYTITRNAALDELRRRRREAPLPEGRLASTPSPDRNPLNDLEEGELRAMAEEAIAGLTPRRREIFRLVRESGLSYKEVAQVLDLSPQTVANLMSLALADLRAALGPILGSGQETSPGPLPPRSPRQASGSD